MKIIWGSFITDGRNKLANEVASRNHYGPFMRRRAIPLNVATSYRNATRTRFINVQKNWRTITDAQRAAWEKATVNFKQTDAFGVLNRLTAINLYCRMNYNRNLISQNYLTLPPPKIIVTPPRITNFVIYNMGANIEFAFSPTVPSNHSYFVYMTKPISAGITNPNAFWTFIRYFPQNYTSPRSLDDIYLPRFSVTGAIGKRIFLKIRAFDNINAQFSQYSYSKCIIS